MSEALAFRNHSEGSYLAENTRLYESVSGGTRLYMLDIQTPQGLETFSCVGLMTHREALLGAQSLKKFKDCCVYPLPCIHFFIESSSMPLHTGTTRFMKPQRYYIQKGCRMWLKGNTSILESCPKKIDIRLSKWVESRLSQNREDSEKQKWKLLSEMKLGKANKF